jgi:hypothetical protein
MSEVALPGPLFIVLRAQIATWSARGQQVGDDARDFMGGGDDGRFGALASPHPPVVGSQAMVAATDGLRREPKGLAGAIAGLQRAPASDLPAGDLVTRGEAQPGTERLLVGPLPHVQADFSDNGLHRAGVQPRDRHQIHPSTPVGNEADYILSLMADAAIHFDKEKYAK